MVRGAVGGCPLRQWTIKSKVLESRAVKKDSPCPCGLIAGKAEKCVVPHGGYCKGEQQRMWLGSDNEAETPSLMSQSCDVILTGHNTCRCFEALSWSTEWEERKAT